MNHVMCNKLSHRGNRGANTAKQTVMHVPYTLIELLITLAIISILMTLLISAMSTAQSKGKTITNESPEYALVCIPKARQAYKMILEGSDSQKNFSN